VNKDLYIFANVLEKLMYRILQIFLENQHIFIQVSVWFQEKSYYTSLTLSLKLNYWILMLPASWRNQCGRLSRPGEVYLIWSSKRKTRYSVKELQG